ncbi:MAG: hypothetical protein [Microvirus sp.]|nr:MAG: hypothetical protein [Microvirus sp.]
MLLILWAQAILLGLVLSSTGAILYEKAQTEPRCIQPQVPQGYESPQAQPRIADAWRDPPVGDAVLQPGQRVENVSGFRGVQTGPRCK